MDCNIITNRYSTATFGMSFSTHILSMFPSLLQLDHTCVCFLCRPNWQEFYRFPRGSEKKVDKSTNGSVEAPLVFLL